MPNTLLSAREIYDIAPLGSLIRFSDGTPEPPARHRRKRTAWLSNNVSFGRTRRITSPALPSRFISTTSAAAM
jgi:hypothetical protein